MKVLNLSLNVCYSVTIEATKTLPFPSSKAGPIEPAPLKVSKKDSIQKQSNLFVNTLDFIKKHAYTEYVALIKANVSLLSRVRKIGNKVYYYSEMLECI